MPFITRQVAAVFALSAGPALASSTASSPPAPSTRRDCANDALLTGAATWVDVLSAIAVVSPPLFVGVESGPRPWTSRPLACYDVGVAPTALITGVGRRRGIGAGIAARLANDGWDLVLSYWQPYDDCIGLKRDAGDPERLAGELRQSGGAVALASLADPVTVSAVVQTAVELVGPLDALVMSHCESVGSGVLDTTIESFDTPLRRQRATTPSTSAPHNY